ncbi:MAG: hypothetical protein KGZ84_08975 [Erysipelotrichia bacterium]|jgi:hypothetical protein|nr:hypothetical protein [Erysipelotrichia bacterium]
MLKNLLKTVQQYADDFKELELEYIQNQQKLKESYQGDMYKSQISSLTQNYNQKIEALKERAKTLIDKEVTEARSAIKAVITKPITADQFNLIQTAKLLKETNGLSEVEKQEIMNKCKGNYLATRTLVDIFGINYAPDNHHAEGLLSRIDGAVTLINKNVIQAQGFSTDRSSFTSAFILKGDMISNIQTDVSSFVESYSDSAQ